MLLCQTLSGLWKFVWTFAAPIHQVIATGDGSNGGMRALAANPTLVFTVLQPDEAEELSDKPSPAWPCTSLNSPEMQLTHLEADCPTRLIRY
jgi:hypothetical protein